MEEALTLKNYNQLKLIDTLKAIGDKLTEKNDALEKEVVRLKNELNNNHSQFTNQQNELNRTRQTLENKNQLLADSREETLRLSNKAGRVYDLERQYGDLKRQNERDLEVKNLIITRQSKEIVELKEKVEQLQDELDDIEIIDSDESEEHEPFEMPKTEDDELLEHKESVIRDLIEDENIGFTELAVLKDAKMSLGGTLNANEATTLSPDEIAKKEVEAALVLWKNKIPESELKRIPHLVYDSSGFRVEVSIGKKKILKRNYLNPSFSPIN